MTKMREWIKSTYSTQGESNCVEVTVWCARGEAQGS